VPDVTLSIITIGIPPTFEVGPITVAWHGLTIAIGVLIGGLAGARYARERGLDTEVLQKLALLLIIGALIGGRLFYLAEHGDLAEPDRWFGTTGFTFNGGFIGAALLMAAYLRRRRLGAGYLDAVAAGLPLGVAIGRIGDVINGEHYGPATTFFLGVRNSHPDALVPNHSVAYHSGGLYEVLLGALIFATVWPLRRRLARPTAMTWTVIALFAAGRFVEFFARRDSDQLALGLDTAQWTSVALLIVAATGAAITLRRPPPPDGQPAGSHR